MHYSTSRLLMQGGCFVSLLHVPRPSWSMLQLDTDAGAAAELISAAAPSSAGNDRLYLGTLLTEHGMGLTPGMMGGLPASRKNTSSATAMRLWPSSSVTMASLRAAWVEISSLSKEKIADLVVLHQGHADHLVGLIIHLLSRAELNPLFKVHIYLKICPIAMMTFERLPWSIRCRFRSPRGALRCAVPRRFPPRRLPPPCPRGPHR